MFNIKFHSQIFINLLFIIVCIILFSGLISSQTVDLASHYTLVRKIYNDFWINSGYILNLGEMSNYPPVAHYFAAFFAFIFGEVLLGINAVVVISIFIFYSTLFYLILHSKIYSFVVLPLLFLIYYGTRLPVIGQEAFGDNFLFAQLFSMSYFSLVILILHNSIKNNVKHFFIYTLSTFIIALCIHPSMAVVYFIYCIFFDFIYGSKLIRKKINFKNYKNFIIFIIFGGCLFKFHYYTQFSQAIKNHNGSLGFSALKIGALDINIIGIILILFGLLFSISFILKHFKINNINDSFTIIDSFSLIILSFTTITILQFILFYYNIVSAYVVKKNFFGLFTFLMIIFFMSLKKIYSFSKLNNFINKFGCYLAPFLASIVCFIFFNRVNVDFSVYKPYFDSTKNVTADSRYGDCYRNTITQFSIPMPINWLLSTGELEIYKWGPLSHNIVHALPRELPPRSCVLTDEINVSGQVILVKDNLKLYRASDYNSPRMIDFNNNFLDNPLKKLDNKRILSSGFSDFNGSAFWSVGYVSKIDFKIENSQAKFSKYKLKIGLSGFIFGGKESSKLSLLINSKIFEPILIKSNNVHEFEFLVEDKFIDKNGLFNLQFININPSSPKSLGVNDDNRLINFGIHSLSVEGVL